MYVHFSETLTGCTSIRAYGAEKRFIETSNEKTDVNNSAFYPSLAAARWLSVRLEFLGYVIVFTAALLAVLAKEKLTPGLAGLSVSYALTVSSPSPRFIECIQYIPYSPRTIPACRSRAH